MNQTEVMVAVIGAIGVIGAAGFGFLGVWVQSIKKSIGDPNGHGDVSAMLGKLLDGQAGQDIRLAKLEAGQSRQSSRITSVERRISDLEDKVA